ncbi:MAG: TaqI-like C-terminal specificity domain-containing protein, partial [Dehalococcoidia bacterium]
GHRLGLEYLKSHKTTLEEREEGKMKGDKWYAFGRTQNLALHDSQKLAIPSTVKRLSACYDREGSFYLDNVRINGIILKNGSDSNYKYITGLLNSKLMHWYFVKGAVRFANGYYAANRQFIESLPIRNVNPKDTNQKRLHDSIIASAAQMIELKKHLSSIEGIPSNERDEIAHQIELTDREIDNLVYDLYELTPEERQIVDKGI